MAFQKGVSGNPKGKPKGAISKPRISDYLTKEQIDALVKKAYSMARRGNEVMLKFVLEQNFGKAMQPVEGEMKGNITITFDTAFNK